jgi:hypothetical protein
MMQGFDAHDRQVIETSEGAVFKFAPHDRREFGPVTQQGGL